MERNQVEKGGASFLAMYSDGQGGQIGYLSNMAEVKRWAYSQAAWLVMNGFGPYTMTCLDDRIIVQGIGVAPVTYCVEKLAA